MTENFNEWRKVSFTEYLNKDGSIIQSDIVLHGEAFHFHNTPIEKGNIRVASVNCTDGEMYFVPFDSLTFNDKV